MFIVVVVVAFRYNRKSERYKFSRAESFFRVN